MTNGNYRVANKAAAMLDEDAVVTILSRYFPSAGREVVRNAAEDVLLLELLARDIGVVWEDAMCDPTEMAMNAYDAPRRHES